MKKVLLGTSAIALAGAFASPAAAADWNVRVGGYMEQFIAYASSNFDNPALKGHYDGIDSKQDSEIWFIPTLTMDNGIKIGANVQLEALTDSDQIDESYMFIQGSFGEVDLGSENSAGYKMTYAAPDVTFINVNSGSTTAFIPWSGGSAGADVFRGPLGSTYLENDRNNDAQRFTYYTPRFAGFQVGASYARDGNQDSNGQINCSGTTLCSYVDLGANYVNTFGDFNVAVSGRYGIAFRSGAQDPEVFGAGINLGYMGFTVGGSWAKQIKDGVRNGEAWDAGISYETGPWAFSFTYFNGRSVGNGDPVPSGAPAASGAEFGSEHVSQYLVGANYALAKGVTLGAFGAYVDFSDAASAGEFATNGSIDGFIIGSGIKIAF